MPPNWVGTISVGLTKLVAVSWRKFAKSLKSVRDQPKANRIGGLPFHASVVVVNPGEIPRNDEVLPPLVARWCSARQTVKTRAA